MKIILQQPVDGLGVPGDVVSVKDGYANNFLLPRGLAIKASRGAMKHAESLQAAENRRREKTRGAAEDLAASLKTMPVLIRMKAGEDGTLFGSVTNADVATAIEESAADGTTIDKKVVVIDEPIKSIGAHTVHLKLHPDVIVDLTVEVDREV
jgi:large subunit ribosomal protein L9